MALRTEHQIADLRRSSGELSFQARVGGETRAVWFRTKTAVTPPADAALAACLMPSMRHGGSLSMAEPVSPRVLRNQREFQAIQAAWSRDWGFGDPPLEQVEVLAPVRELESAPTGRVGAFFSGGVDSWSTIIDNPDVTDLIFVRGIDILPGAEHQAGLADRVEARLGEAAAKLGLEFHVVETNLRELSDPLIRWEAYYGCAVVAVALFLEPLFDRILIAGDSDYEVQVKLGANWLVDQLWSTEGLEIVDDGGEFSRVERTRRVAAHPVAQETLRVCWENHGGAYNCGHCRKCLMTMITLEGLGAREAVSTFPRQLDLAAISAIEITRPVTLTLWEDVLDAARSARRPDLERPLEALVADAKRGLGLAPEYRRRRLVGPPRSLSATAGPAAIHSPGTLFATPATAAAIAAAPALAILIGSYDGSGNFGDIAQLDAGLDLFERLGEEILIAPVVERSLMASHDDLRSDLLHHIEHTLYFDPGATGPEDGLVPVSAGAELDFATCYLYGGGYLNAFWGARKLAMLGAAERLFESAGSPPVARLSSGLQVDPDWVSKLAPADAEALRGLDLLGSRDSRSHHALGRLGSTAPLLETGDDALGILAGLPTDPVPADTAGPLQVNLHFGPHKWVTERVDTLLDFYVDFLDGLQRRCGRPLRVLPLLTYVDSRTDEGPSLSRLAGACSERGVVFGEPIELRPASLAGAAPELRRAGLTLSCSYHLALTSLMLGVPAALLADTPYYSQKAGGLLDAFGLPAGFAPASDDDGMVAAERIAAVLFDSDARADLEARIGGGGSMLRLRRAATETELLGRIAMRAIAAGGGARSTDPLETERREGAARAELETILASRSWRLAAPLRGAATRARTLRDQAKAALRRGRRPR